jgi:hypothetical protein
MLAFLTLLAPASATNVRRGAVPASGICQNEGDFKTGNHCVKMTRPEIEIFQKATSQDFGAPNEWCICLHLYESEGGKNKYPNADTSQCSEGALSASE